VKRQEKSDNPIVPKPRRKSRSSSQDDVGKGITASKVANQLELFPSFAEHPLGSSGRSAKDRSLAGRHKRRTEENRTRTDLPAMRMEEVARIENLYSAFDKVKANRGKPGQVNSYLEGWMGFFRICSESEKYHLRGYDAHIRRRLRAMHLKQWKRRRTIYAKLQELGVTAQTARIVFSRKKGLWALSHCIPVDRGLNNRYFLKIGLKPLISLWDKYNPKSTTALGEQLWLF